MIDISQGEIQVTSIQPNDSSTKRGWGKTGPAHSVTGKCSAEFRCGACERKMTRVREKMKMTIYLRYFAFSKIRLLLISSYPFI